MFITSKIRIGARALALAFALALSSFSAQAVLERAGPVSNAPSIGGFPAWYQDTTGLALEFCDPINATELSGGWCLLLPANVPTVPETFPSSFFVEHFYSGATGTLDLRTGGRTKLVMNMEASFANGFKVIPGDQTTFARIRFLMSAVPLTGTYRIIHPYGEELLRGIAGDRIFFTNDVGLGCGQSFDCALTSRMGPFLLPSATPGGLEMAPLTETNPTPDTDPAHFKGAFAPTAYPGTGKAYIADPARIGPVTGSALPDFVDSTGALRNHNIFRIEGPVGSGIGVDATGAVVDWIETTDFALNGRVYTGTLPGKFNVDRASYTHGAAGQKLDVFATAVPTGPGRIPASPRPASVAQTLTFFDAPCAGTLDPVTGATLPPFSAPLGAIETPMKAAGALQWAQTQPTVIPSSVCVKDASATDAAGVVVPIYLPKTVRDEVAVTPAFYDPSVGTLTVGASSSDTVLPPSLSLAYGSYVGDLVAGQIAVPSLLAPPASVQVASSALGNTRYQVSTGFAAAPAAALPLATNDNYSFPMNSSAQLLNILANDTNVAGGTVAITSAPQLGTAVLNADGTVSYTPNLNASGTDAFTYTVTVGTQTSNTGIVTLDITSVNLPPSAVNDSVNALINLPRQISVLANDTDPNGVTDIVAAVNVTQPLPAGNGATTSVSGGIVTFNAVKSGTYTFTYQAQDAGGLVSSNAATVTVQAATSESISFQKAIYTVSQSKLVAQGTLTPVMNQTVKLEYIDSAGKVLGTAGTVPCDSLGNWQLQLVGVPLPTGTVSLKATTSNGTVKAQSLQLK